MDKNQEQTPISFVDLASFQNVHVTKRGSTGSILKAGSVEPGSVQKIEADPNGNSQPEIILHRNGDAIERVEVVCTCGRHTEIRLEYDGD